MNDIKTEYFKSLHRQYMAEVRKFLKALKENASRSELIIIRTNVKRLLAEIRKYTPTIVNPNELPHK